MVSLKPSPFKRPSLDLPNSLMRIRRAREDDVRKLAEVQVDCWRKGFEGILPQERLDTLPVDQFEARWKINLTNENRKLLVCEVDENVAGFLAWGPSRDSDCNPDCIGEVYGIYVHPSMWRRGCGEALMRTCLTDLPPTGRSNAILWVYEANLRGRRFCERLGFVLEPGMYKRVERLGATPREMRYRRILEALSPEHAHPRNPLASALIPQSIPS